MIWRSGLRHMASSDWIKHIISAVIMRICMYCTHVFGSTNILPSHRSTPHNFFSLIGSWHIIGQHQLISQRYISSQYHINSSNRMLPHHRSVPRHWSLPRRRSVYVNNVMNSTVNSIVYVNIVVHMNNVVYFFILLLRFSTIMSSKLLSALLSNFLFLVKWPLCPLKYIKYLIIIKHI